MIICINFNLDLEQIIQQICLSHLIDKILKGFAENLLTGMIIIETFDTKTFCYKNLTQSNS